MSSSAWAFLLQLLGQLLSEGPHLIQDVKDLIASIEGNAPDPATQPPLEPEVASRTQAEADALNAKTLSGLRTAP